MLSGTIVTMINIGLGKERVGLTKKFLDSGNCECEEEFIQSWLPYVNVANYLMMMVRIIALIISYWRPSFCKQFLLISMITIAVRDSAPI